jgi:hypothetical protein
VLQQFAAQPVDRLLSSRAGVGFSSNPAPHHDLPHLPPSSRLMWGNSLLPTACCQPMWRPRCSSCTACRA